MCAPGRQVGQLGSRRSDSSEKRVPSASKVRSRPTSGSPMPSSSFSTSLAWMSPMSPGSTPSTPASAQEGASLRAAATDETAVTGADARKQGGRLTLEAIDASVNQGNALQYAGIVEQVAGGKVVPPVHHHLEALDDPQHVRRGEALGEGQDLDAGIERQERLPCTLGLGPSSIGGAMKDLTLEIAHLHPVGIDDAQRPDASGGEMRAAGEPRPPAPSSSTRAESSRACPASPTSGRVRCRRYRALCSLGRCSGRTRGSPRPLHRPKPPASEATWA